MTIGIFFQGIEKRNQGNKGKGEERDRRLAKNEQGSTKNWQNESQRGVPCLVCPMARPQEASGRRREACSIRREFGLKEIKKSHRLSCYELMVEGVGSDNGEKLFFPVSHSPSLIFVVYMIVPKNMC